MAALNSDPFELTDPRTVATVTASASAGTISGIAYDRESSSTGRSTSKESTNLQKEQLNDHKIVDDAMRRGIHGTCA